MDCHWRSTPELSSAKKAENVLSEMKLQNSNNIKLHDKTAHSPADYLRKRPRDANAPDPMIDEERRMSKRE
jgi:hypothetical protein